MTGPPISERNPARDYAEFMGGEQPKPKSFLEKWEGVIKATELKPRAKGRPRHVPGTMNKTEQKYAAELEAQQKAGEIVWWAFEPFKLRLAKNTTYSPDFAVMYPDGRIECVETKGHWEDDARVKIKCAAETFFMFQFVALTPRAKKDGGGWKREEF